MTPPTTIATLRRYAVAHTFADEPTLLDAVRSLGFVQADPIRAPARAQDLILRHRVRDYRAGQLEAMYPDLPLDEGMLYAYGFVPSATWSLLRGRRMKAATTFERAVYDAVCERGRTHPRDLDATFGTKNTRNDWGGRSRETKRALESLHRRGWLRVAARDKGVRVYAEAPPISATTAGASRDPSDVLCALALVLVGVFAPARLRSLRAFMGRIGKAHADPAAGREALTALIGEGRLGTAEVDGETYVMPAAGAPVRATPDRVRILAPFDPLVHDRERFAQLWGWDYRFEAYTPRAKRQRGYYAMPLLWRDDVIGWVNARVDAGALDLDLGFVRSRPDEAAFEHALDAEVTRFARFLDADARTVSAQSPVQRTL